jgi:hypothetical protein
MVDLEDLIPVMKGAETDQIPSPKDFSWNQMTVGNTFMFRLFIR